MIDAATITRTSAAVLSIIECTVILPVTVDAADLQAFCCGYRIQFPLLCLSIRPASEKQVSQDGYQTKASTLAVAGLVCLVYMVLFIIRPQTACSDAAGLWVAVCINKHSHKLCVKTGSAAFQFLMEGSQDSLQLSETLTAYLGICVSFN